MNFGSLHKADICPPLLSLCPQIIRDAQSLKAPLQHRVMGEAQYNVTITLCRGVRLPFCLLAHTSHIAC